MNPLRALPSILLSSIKSRLGGESADTPSSARQKGKGQNLLRLHEYQHRVLVELFRVSIAGFLAFSLLLLGISLYSLVNPSAPHWMALIIALLSVVLLFGLFRTCKEFRGYKQNYEEVTAQLRAKLAQKSRQASGKGSPSRSGVEHRLLSTLKPKEHEGWDHKSCKNCQKTLELLSSICQHCGQEQETLLVN